MKTRHQTGGRSVLARIPGWLRSAICYAVIAIIAYFGFMANRGQPPRLFWDENYHVTSAERYLAGIAHLEPHPPLGLLLISAGEALSGANRNVDKHALTLTKQIAGDAMPAGFDFSGMRLMPSLFAALGALAFFGLLLEMFGNRLHALLLSGLFLFENAFTVHFRAVHLDSFQIFFCIAFFWYFVHLWQRCGPIRLRQYAGLGALAAMAILVKMNGVVLLVLFPVLYIKDVDSRQFDRWPQRLLDLCLRSGSVMASMALVVFVVFYIHALLTPLAPDRSGSAGKQDLENMSPAYLAHLKQHKPPGPGTVLVIARDYYKFMEKDHLGVPKLDRTKPGENGSHPIEWPFHERTINYRWDSANGSTAYVQLAGNQLAWYSGTIAVILSIILIVNHRIFAIPLRGGFATYRLIEVFTGVYLVYMLLHVWIITQRVMYMYHYFIGLLVSYILLALMWQYLSEVHARFFRHRTAILATMMSLYFFCYLFFLPFSNHWPLTKQACQRRNIGVSQLVPCQ